MTTASTKVLIVDDSSVSRRLVALALENDPDFEIVGTAGDGLDAMAKVEQTRPDVIVLDLIMPASDGFDTVLELKKTHPNVKIVVFSNVDVDASDVLREAFLAQSITWTPKPRNVTNVEEAIGLIRRNLVSKLPRPSRSGSSEVGDGEPRPPVSAICIAVSTGGPRALEHIFANLPALPVPTFVVQHISADFSTRLAARLDEVGAAETAEAADREIVGPGGVRLAPGGRHLRLARRGHEVVTVLDDGPPVNSCRPSADVLFQSAAEVYGKSVLGIVLTGIGEDGLEGCRTLRELGATILVQDEASSIVWGMPGAVADAGLATEIVTLTSMADRINRLVLARPLARR